MIAEITGFRGRIVWDASQPDGQPRRLLDISKARSLFGYVPKVGFEQGLRETIAWYQSETSGSRHML